MTIESKPNHGDRVLAGEGLSREFQAFFDDVEEGINTPVMPSFTVSNLPRQKEGAVIYVSDETGGAVLAFSDGTDWRRVTDRAVVS